MRLSFFDTHGFERRIFEKVNESFNHSIDFLEHRLNSSTLKLAEGSKALCCFVNDHLSADNLELLKKQGTEIILLRSAGFNHVTMDAAKRLKIRVTRVPEYSPYSVAEYAVALILCLNRKLHRAFNRVREGNFALEGLVGFDLYRKTVGIVGTGRIGSVFARIMRGFGCEILLFDKMENPSFAQEIGAHYVPMDTLIERSDIISLHCPLTPQSKYLLNEAAFARMKDGAMIINTGRGALIESRALVTALKTGKVGFAGLDVYEEEEGVFFEDHSAEILQDDTLARLMTFPNVLLTSHQAFLTHEALESIARTTLSSLTEFELGNSLVNEIIL